MKTALITGASGGIGKEFAYIFAENGYDLILVARSTDKLIQLATHLEKEHNIKATALPFDLAQAKSASLLHAEIKNQNIQIDVLINNAGIGEYAPFVENSLGEMTKSIHLNITTLTELTLLFVKEMKQRNSGKILNVASTAAFQPIPQMAVYGGTKSYVLNFTEALHFELKETNISVTALCPGATHTGFEEAANMKGSKLFKSGVLSAQEVALTGYKGLMRNQMTVIPGFKNKFLATLANMTPSRKLLVWVSAKLTS